MTCAEFQSDISRLLDNELPDERQVATFSHLTACASCREFFKSSRFIRRHLDDLPVYPTDLDIRIQTAAARHRRTAAHPPSHSHRRAFLGRSVRVPLPAVAAILLALGTSLFFAVDAATTARPQEERVIYVPTLPEVEVEAAIATTTTNMR